MEGLEVGKVCGERDEVGWALRPVELQEVGPERVGVASPAEFSESLLEFWVGANDVVGWEVDQDPRSSPRRSGCARIGRLFLLKRLPRRVRDQPSDAVFVEYPHPGHAEFAEMYMEMEGNVVVVMRVKGFWSLEDEKDTWVRVIRVVGWELEYGKCGYVFFRESMLNPILLIAQEQTIINTPVPSSNKYIYKCFAVSTLYCISIIWDFWKPLRHLIVTRKIDEDNVTRQNSYLILMCQHIFELSKSFAKYVYKLLDHQKA